MGKNTDLNRERSFGKESKIVLLTFVLVMAFALSSLPMLGVANETPTVEIEHPVDGATVKGTVLVYGVAWDDVEVVGVDLIFDHSIDDEATITGKEGDLWNWEYEWDTTAFEDGWHLVQARAWDGELFSQLHSIEVYVENEEVNHRPEVTIEVPESGAVLSGTVIIKGHAWDPDENDTVEMVQVAFDSDSQWFNATDVSGNGTFWSWEYEWDTTEVENGEHTIFARAWDGELYSEVVHVYIIVKNEVNERPKCWIEYPENGDTVSGIVEIMIAASDDNEVTKVEVSIDWEEWDEAVFSHMIEEVSIWYYEWNTTTVEDGWHTILARAYDGELYSVIYDIHVIVDNVQENKKPWVTVEYPEDWEVVNGTIEIWGHAGDPDENDTVELVQIAIDNDDIWLDCVDTSGNDTWWTWVYVLDTTELENGKHFILARSWDGELYSTIVEFHIVVENEVENHRPEVKIVHPIKHEVLSGVVLVHGEAWDPDEGDRVEKVMARINSGDWFMTVDTSHDDSWSTWAFQWDTAQYENGEHCIYAKSYDGELWSEVAVVCVFVENENHRPEVSITHPEWDEVVGGLYLIHGTASDPDAGDSVEMVLVRINDGDWKHATDTSPDGSFATWAYEWNTKEVEDGEHRICAKSWDGALFSEVVCVEVTVENVNDPPRVEILHPEMGANVTGIVLVHGTAKDDRGVEMVFVRVDDGDWDEAVDISQDHSWRTWGWEWVTTEYENGWHRVCAIAWDGDLHSDQDCVEVYVDNEMGGEGQSPEEDLLSQSGSFLALLIALALGFFAVIGEIIRRHFSLGKQ